MVQKGDPIQISIRQFAGRRDFEVVDADADPKRAVEANPAAFRLRSADDLPESHSLDAFTVEDVENGDKWMVVLQADTVLLFWFTQDGSKLAGGHHEANPSALDY